ncbi:MAG: cytochrome-c peroxidase, partial [Bacteroidota bacterium]
EFLTIDEVLDHYNLIPANNPQLDPRLRPGGNPQRLNLTEAERSAVIAFLRTLSGNELYTDERWRDPFLD